MKKLLALALALCLAAGLTCPALAQTPAARYGDMDPGAWYAPAVETLLGLGVLPGGAHFGPMRAVTRLEFIRCLYRLHLALGGAAWSDPEKPLYADLPADGSESARAVAWAAGSGVSNGVPGGRFAPDGLLTREQCCTLLCRFAAGEHILLAKKETEGLFRDAIRVSPFARSGVTACKLAGLVSGYADGTVAPKSNVLRCEAAAMLERLYRAAGASVRWPVVLLEPGAYDVLYSRYDYTFGDPVPAGDPVDPAWFNDAVFIGDSVTVRLEMYCASTRALGGAAFLCSTSLSAPNALRPVGPSSLHPAYNGVKQKLEDSVAACGAKNVYIMLGINNMRSSVDVSTASLVTLIEKILEKSPGVNIFVQSVTPMAATSNILAGNINNLKILEYNARMQELCRAHGWYYLDVASAVRDDLGNLRADCCGDPRGMGLHFTSAGAAIWCNYLKTHVPEALKAEGLPPPPDRAEEPPAPEAPPADPSAPSLAAVRDAMLAGLEGREPLLLDREALCQMYLLEESWVVQGAGAILMEGSFPDELILVEAADEAATAQVAAALRERLEEVLRQAKLYDEADYASAQRCRVVTEGRFVRLLLSREEERFAALYEAFMHP